MYDLIIIGSGPAGLSAAVYGKRAGLNLLIIEEKPILKCITMYLIRLLKCYTVLRI